MLKISVFADSPNSICLFPWDLYGRNVGTRKTGALELPDGENPMIFRSFILTH